MRHKQVKNLIVGGALISAFFISQASAYDAVNTHPALTDEVVDFYNLNFPQKLSNQDKTWIIKGSTDEDQGVRPMNHFYDPVYNRGMAGFSTSKQWAMSSGVQSNFFAMSSNYDIAEASGAIKRKSPDDFSYQRAIDDYAQGDRQRAMIGLGHTLHLLEDAGVPDHTRNDAHPPVSNFGSPYEHEMAKWNPDNFNIATKLKKEGLKPVTLANVGDYFDNLAKYSNGNFFSKDTVSNIEYPNPSLANTKELFVNGDKKLFIVGRGRNNEEFPLAVLKTRPGNVRIIEKKFLTTPEIGSYILDGYWDRLSKEVVLNGAGALNLFLTEAERAKTEYANRPPAGPNWFSRMLGLIGISTNSDVVDNSTIGDTMVTPTLKVTNPVVTSTPLVTKTPDTSVTTPTPVLSPSNTPVQTPKPSVTPSPSPTPKLSTAKKSGRVVINEIAWAGTSASATDEWIELYNAENSPIDISSWELVSNDNSPDIIFTEGTIIQANSYFLIERKDDNTVSDITADLVASFGQGGLSNSGEMVRLFDSAGTVVDVVGGIGEAWYFGDSTSKSSMERIDPMVVGNIASNWKSFSGTPVNKDAAGGLILGTPRAKNSTLAVVFNFGGGGGGGSPSTPTPVPSLSPTPTPTPSPSPTPTPSPTPSLTPSPSPAEKININTGTKEQLMTLWGIGDVKSNAIIEYRTTKGPFKKIEDIMNISGIGQATFDKIKNNITVGNVVLKPYAVADLVAGHHSPAVTATWSAPDPGGYNTASLSYDFRYSAINFPDTNTWDKATTIASSSLPNVGEKGAPQSASFNVVYEYGQTFYFAMKTKLKNCGNGYCEKSDISNVATVSFPTALDKNAWSMLGKDQYHTSFADNLTGPGVGATLSWEYNAGAGRAVSQPVVSAAGNVYFGAADGSSGKLIKLDKNRVKQWEYVTNVSIGTPAVLSDETVYFGRIGAGGFLPLTALKPDGTKKWDYNDASTVRGISVSLKGEPYFTLTIGSDKLVALNTDGSLKTTVISLGLEGSTPVVLDNSTAIVAKHLSGNQFFNAYSANGTQFWPSELFYTGANGNTPADPSYDLKTGKTYSAAGSYLFDIPSSGSVLNSHAVDPLGVAATTVAISPDTLYLGFNDINPASGSRLFAINKSDLTVKWAKPFAIGSRINSQLAVDKDDNIYFSTAKGSVYGVDRNGAKKWKVDTGMASFISPVLTENGLIWGYGSVILGIK